MAGVFQNQGIDPDPKTCFVMMPFAESFNAIYRLIQRCCNEQGLKCVRADEDVKPGKITGKIYEMVSSAGVVIADMTGRNPNVFYELGLAHAISDNVILLTQATDDVPFDLRDFLHIRYSNSFDGAEKLANDLAKVLTAILSSAVLQLPEGDDRRKHLQEEVPSVPVEDLDLGLLHLQAEISRNSGDMSKASEWLQKALEAARAGIGDADEIGNCAIESERCELYSLAETLYGLALEKDHTHINNRQAYVSFLLDHRSGDAGKIEIAGGLLDELEKTHERQERTRGLRAQYLALVQSQSGTQVDFDDIIADSVGDGDFQTLQQAGPALFVLQNARRFEDMRNLSDRLRPNLDEQDCLILDRVLSDAFASSGDDSLRAEAVNLYSELLAKSEGDQTDVKHNLATLLFSTDPRDLGGRAMQLWSEAYSERPSDSAIRKAFAQYLLRQGRENDAANVLAGEAIG